MRKSRPDATLRFAVVRREQRCRSANERLLFGAPDRDVFREQDKAIP